LRDSAVFFFTTDRHVITVLNHGTLGSSTYYGTTQYFHAQCSHSRAVSTIILDTTFFDSKDVDQRFKEIAAKFATSSTLGMDQTSQRWN